MVSQPLVYLFIYSTDRFDLISSLCRAEERRYVGDTFSRCPWKIQLEYFLMETSKRESGFIFDNCWMRITLLWDSVRLESWVLNILCGKCNQSKGIDVLVVFREDISRNCKDHILYTYKNVLHRNHFRIYFGHQCSSSRDIEDLW